MKNVLITGSTGEIGSAIALSFAEKGYNVALHTFSKPEKLCTTPVTSGN